MSRPYGFHDLPYHVRMSIQTAESRRGRARGDAAYWRNAYELLVKQTGRDLNDGLGIDPRTQPKDKPNG